MERSVVPELQKIAKELSLAIVCDDFRRNFRLQKLFAIDGRRRDDCAVRIDDCRCATKSNAVVCADAISQNEMALVFDSVRDRMRVFAHRRKDLY
jgi:hypothetical protein